MQSDHAWNLWDDAPDRWTVVEVRYADGSTGRARWSGIWQIAADHQPVGWRYLDENTADAPAVR